MVDIPRDGFISKENVSVQKLQRIEQKNLSGLILALLIFISSILGPQQATAIDACTEMQYDRATAIDLQQVQIQLTDIVAKLNSNIVPFVEGLIFGAALFNSFERFLQEIAFINAYLRERNNQS
jgi:hypothetical protein